MKQQQAVDGLQFRGMLVGQVKAATEVLLHARAELEKDLAIGHSMPEQTQLEAMNEISGAVRRCLKTVACLTGDEGGTEPGKESQS